jgi:hypothetical protein
VVIKTNDEKRFAGKDAEAVVRAMKRDRWYLTERPKREYMEEVAGRVQEMTGSVIRLDAEGFLLDLQHLGLIQFEALGVA